MADIAAQRHDEHSRELASERAARVSIEAKHRALQEANERLETALAEAREMTRRASEAERRERFARERAEQLQHLTAALSVATTPEAVADAAIERAQMSFAHAAGVVVARRNDARDALELIRATDMPREVFEQWRYIPVSTEAPLTDVCRTGVPLFLESPADWAAKYPHLMSLIEQNPHRAQMVAPLIVAGRVVGALGIAFREPRTFNEDEREFVLSVAGQCAVALERARLYEAESHARTTAENANRAKGAFLAAMSHELRTPLNAIAGHVDLLLMKLYGPTTEQQDDALYRVKRAQQHLLSVIDDLLSFARLERGKVDFHLAPVRVREIVKDIAPMIGPQMSAKGLIYETRLPENDLEVIADRGKLAQILLNLLSNAVKFTPAGGRVELMASEDTSDDTERARYVAITVTDAGVGIPANKLQAVFDPFVQLDTSPASRHEGTGLGLAISRDLARGMGGDLTASSILGQSTTFTLVLPSGASRQ
jgi:signal transduction histidine kinase